MQKPNAPKSCDVSAILGYITALERYVKELEAYIVFQEAQNPDRLTTQEVATILHCARRYVTKLFHARRLTGKLYGNVLLLDRSSVLTFQNLDARSTEAKELGYVAIATAQSEIAT